MNMRRDLPHLFLYKYIDNTTKHLSEGRDDVTYILAQVQDDFYGNVGTYR